MPNVLEGRHVVLGVAGSIACYKAADLASKLTQQSALVDVVMTEAATRLVSPLTFRSLTHRPVTVDMFDPDSELSIEHVARAERADLIIVAPATANVIAKMAIGLSDDALTATVLATRAPVIVAPAMDGNMYDNPATRENIDKLSSRGYTIAGPATGRLASGLYGPGRLLETAELLGYARLVLGRAGDLAGRKIVASAGGTREAIDPVRFISNRSSGKMGSAVAEAARDRGATAVLVTGPSALPVPVGVRVERVVSALEMRDRLVEECRDADALIMAAAVSDWRPAESQPSKVKKTGTQGMTLQLVQNPDIVADVQGDHLVKVGFAAETEDLLVNARSKLMSKGLHLVAANDVSADDAGFDGDLNRVILIDRDGGAEELGLITKYDVGHRILDRVLALMS